jgi:TolA-binding protein
MKSIISKTSILLVCVSSMTGCLKSRFQYRGDGDDQVAVTPIPAQVKDVRPQDEYVLDEIKLELTRLNGRIEELERASHATSDSSIQKDDFKKFESRIVELEQAQAKIIETIQKNKQNESVSAEESEGLYKKGKSKYNLEQYDEAIEIFTEYLKNSKASDTEDATYYRAESYFKLKQYKKAIVDYSRFPEKFTRSKHMPAALFKIGNSFDALGMKEDAKGFYQELVDKFPKAAEAKKARSKLK